MVGSISIVTTGVEEEPLLAEPEKTNNNEQHILDTNAGKQLSYAVTDV